MPLYVSSSVRVTVRTFHAFVQNVSIAAYFLLSHHAVYTCLPLPDY